VHPKEAICPCHQCRELNRSAGKKQEELKTGCAAKPGSPEPARSPERIVPKLYAKSA
jgi:hypothetical protein